MMKRVAVTIGAIAVITSIILGRLAWKNQWGWEAKPYPACKTLAGKTHRWNRLVFLVPEGWTPEFGDNSLKRKGRKTLSLRRGEAYRDYLESIHISIDPGDDVRAEFEREIPEVSAIPSTVKRTTLAGRPAVLYRGRDTDQHDQSESWQAMIDRSDAIIGIGGPELEAHPTSERRREVESLHCVFWTVVQSLEVQ